jgi:hypothetical protein
MGLGISLRTAAAAGVAITNGRFRLKIWRVAGVCYIAVTILILVLLQDFGMASTSVLGVLRAICGLGGGTNKNQRVNMTKASSMLACRQGRCRRHLRLGRAVQLPLPIPSSAASACEQAVSRELLLPLTRDTVLAAVPWLKSSPKARH